MSGKGALTLEQQRSLEKFRQILLTKLDPKQNPISKVNECCQRTGIVPTFKGLTPSPNPSAGFACELDYNGIKIIGFGPQKKTAKNNAAEIFLKRCLGETKEDDDNILRDIIENKADSSSSPSTIPKTKTTTAGGTGEPTSAVKKTATAPPAISDSEGRKPDISNEATTSLKVDFLSQSKSIGIGTCNRWDVVGCRYSNNAQV